MKQVKLFLIALSLSTFFGSCLKDSEEDHTPYGYLIYTNAFTEAQSISYFFDGRYTDTQPYRSFTGNPVFTGNRVLVITDPVTNITLLDAPIRFENRQLYYSFFYGTREEPQLLLIEDEGVENLENQSAFRFFHLANELDAPVTVQLLKDDEVVHEYTGREQETGDSAETHKIFDTTEPGTYTIRAVNEDGDMLAIREGRTLTNQSYYTFILVGTPESETHPLYIGEVKYPF